MIRMRKLVLILFCCLPLLKLSGQATNTHLPLVRKLDAMRLPAGDFSARVVVRQSKSGSTDISESIFRQFTRVRTDAGSRSNIDTLLACDSPARDAGKLILLTPAGCWLQTPQARRPARVTAQQVATHALLADWVNWRFADDFDHTHAGSESITSTGDAHACTVLDFTPKPAIKNRAAFMRCWVDASGRLWKAEIYSASRRLMRTVLITRYESLLGVERASRIQLEARGEIEEVLWENVKRQASPPDYFDPDKLPSVLAPLAPPPARR